MGYAPIIWTSISLNATDQISSSLPISKERQFLTFGPSWHVGLALYRSQTHIIFGIWKGSVTCLARNRNPTAKIDS